MNLSKHTRVIIIFSIIFGGLFYLYLALVLSHLSGDNYIGFRFYDYYFLSLLDGRLDMPPRILYFEGHYTPDGTAYPYHGIAPVITRVLASPFVDLSQTSISKISVLLWSLIGTSFWHLAFAQVATRGLAATSRQMPERAIQVLLAVALWLGTPGIFMVVNPSMYHEPIAVTYAVVAIYVWIMVRIQFFGWNSGWALVWLALLAGISVHARPNVAVGLYTGVLIQSAVFLFRSRRQAIPAVVGAVMVLGAFGLAYLGLNQIRFGDPFKIHGSFESTELQYGLVFTGQEERDSGRALAFEEHGRFNARRILPNALIYFVDLPEFVTTKIHDYFRVLTLDSLGFIRVEGPAMGFVYLWPALLLLAATAFIGSSRTFLVMSPLLVATTFAFFLTLSYGTVTFRHRFDFWPFFGVLALAGMLAAINLIDLRRLSGRLYLTAAVTAVGLGVTTTLTTMYHYSRYFHHEQWLNGVMTYEHCREIMQAKEFSGQEIEKLCSLRYTESIDAMK